MLMKILADLIGPNFFSKIVSAIWSLDLFSSASMFTGAFGVASTLGITSTFGIRSAFGPFKGVAFKLRRQPGALAQPKNNSSGCLCILWHQGKNHYFHIRAFLQLHLCRSSDV